MFICVTQSLYIKIVAFLIGFLYNEKVTRGKTLNIIKTPNTNDPRILYNKGKKRIILSLFLLLFQSFMFLISVTIMKS